MVGVLGSYQGKRACPSADSSVQQARLTVILAPNPNLPMGDTVTSHRIGDVQRGHGRSMGKGGVGILCLPECSDLSRLVAQGWATNARGEGVWTTLICILFGNPYSSVVWT